MGTGASTAKYNKWDDAHSQTSSHWDLEIDNNVTWSDAFQFGEPADTTWDLLGSTFELDVQRNRYDEVPLLSLSSADGRIIVADPIQRVIYFKVDADDIQAALKPGMYVYDLVMIYVTGVRVLLMHGNLQVTQGVTYPPVP